MYLAPFRCCGKWVQFSSLEFDGDKVCMPHFSLFACNELINIPPALPSLHPLLSLPTSLLFFVSFLQII